MISRFQTCNASGFSARCNFTEKGDDAGKISEIKFLDGNILTYQTYLLILPGRDVQGGVGIGVEDDSRQLLDVVDG